MPKKPTVDRIDELCRLYKAREKAITAAEKQNSELRDELLALVKKHGFVPPNAEKSKRLEGAEYQCTASFGESVSVDSKVAARFHEICQENVAAEDLFVRVFKYEVKYSLTAAAHSVMAEPFVKGVPRKLRALFNKAVKITAKSPSMKVEARKVEHP